MVIRNTYTNHSSESHSSESNLKIARNRNWTISGVIILHIVTLSKYGHGVLGICVLYTTNNLRYYSAHYNTTQLWSWCTRYSLSVVNRYPEIYLVSCVEEKNGKIKIFFNFSAIKLCFVTMFE